MDFTEWPISHQDCSLLTFTSDRMVFLSQRCFCRMAVRSAVLCMPSPLLGSVGYLLPPPQDLLLSVIAGCLIQNSLLAVSSHLKQSLLLLFASPLCLPSSTSLHFIQVKATSLLDGASWLADHLHGLQALFQKGCYLSGRWVELQGLTSSQQRPWSGCHLLFPVWTVLWSCKPWLESSLHCVCETLNAEGTLCGT